MLLIELFPILAMSSFLLAIPFWILYFGWDIYDVKHLKQPRNDTIIILATVIVMK